MSTEPQEVSLNKEEIEKLREKLSLWDHKISVAIDLYRQTVSLSEGRVSACPEHLDPPKVSDEHLREHLFRELDNHEKMLDFVIKHFESVLDLEKKHQ